MSVDLTTFAPLLIQWQRQHGRHDLPWQKSLQPYPVWLSEIMLQQTQVSTVKAYFERFLSRWPRVQDLAAAELDEVMGLWSGLGYYSRARMLHRCAQTVVHEHAGHFPSDMAALQKLPGIGPSTAAAIASLCFGQAVSIMDGNVRRVLTRLLAFDEDLALSSAQKNLNHHAQSLLPSGRWVKSMPQYTQGLMDLGATVCHSRQPACEQCPMRAMCQGHASGAPTAFPRKTRKLVRRSQAWWLLLLRSPEGGVWLRKRPAQGIWAGLYGPPVFDSEDLAFQSIPLALHRQVALSTPFVHVLTHRDLHLHPLRLTVPASTTWGEGQWWSADAWPPLGLPAPLRRLLSE
jgi:A/G-specific adenine glycosylase